MHVIIEDPSSGTIEYQRELGPDEVMDARTFADQYAESLGVEIDESDGYIPNCCGDIRVEFREDPANSVHIWSGQSFYFKSEGY